MALLLGIDLGTSYFKVGLFDPEGGLRGLGRVRVELQTPAPGRVELAVADFWVLLRRGLVEAMAQAGATVRDIGGISYSSQATSFLLLDAADRPLTPLIIWTDRRGAPIEADVAAFARTAAFQTAVGHEGLVAESAVPKLRWWMRQEPHLWAQAAHVQTISDYFTHALTGERAGDASTAAFLGLYHLGERRWWPEALAAFGLEAARLATPLAPGTPCGRTAATATTLLGLPAGIPFAVGAIDHHAAAIGSGLGRFADVSISTGTVLAALAIVDRVAPAVGCYHGPHVAGAGFYRLAFDPNGAGQLEDYQRRQAPDRRIEELLEWAGQAPIGGGTAEEAGHQRGGAAHGGAVRAILERVALTHHHLVRQAAGGSAVTRVIATGGGARSPLWLQIDADVLEAAVVRPASPERACLGAAAFAAVAAGRHASLAQAVAAMVHPDCVFEPIPANVARYRRWRAEQTGE